MDRKLLDILACPATRQPLMRLEARGLQALNGMDSLLSIVQMPAGIPVATFAIGNAGASNAALFAAALLAPQYADIASALDAFRGKQSDEVTANDEPRLPVSSSGPSV